MMKRDDLYHKALEKYGFLAQSTMVMEECSELTNALCKYSRNRVGRDAVITEIADVIIMCEQMAVFFGEEKVEIEKNKKLNRLEGKLNV